MTPEEIVKRLRASDSWHAVYCGGIMGIDRAPNEAADLIERQAKSLEEAETVLDGWVSWWRTPLAQRPDIAELCCKGAERALATIRALKGE